MALHHQLAVLARSATRPQCSPVDRYVWVLLSTVWSRWQEALAIVHPDTVRRWRRQGWRHHLRWWRGRERPGRPAIAAEIRAFIRRVSQENVLWGAPHIQGELAKLGVRVSRTTIAKYMARRPGPPSPTWRTFLRCYGHDLVASRASAELTRRLHASSVKVMRALRRWLSSWTTRGGQRSSRRDVVPYTRLRETMSMPLVWALWIALIVSLCPHAVHRTISRPTTMPPCLPTCPSLWGRPTCVWPHRLEDSGACISCTDRETASPQGRREASHGQSPPEEMGGRVSGKDRGVPWRRAA
jgi:hypothetical protein